jgi:hypothetical protein
LQVFKEIKEKDKSKDSKKAKETDNKEEKIIIIIINSPFLLLRYNILGFDSYSSN